MSLTPEQREAALNAAAPPDMVLVRRDDLRTLYDEDDEGIPHDVALRLLAAVNGEATTVEYSACDSEREDRSYPLKSAADAWKSARNREREAVQMNQPDDYHVEQRVVGPWVPIAPPVKPALTRWEAKQLDAMDAGERKDTE